MSFVKKILILCATINTILVLVLACSELDHPEFKSLSYLFDDRIKPYVLAGFQSMVSPELYSEVVEMVEKSQHEAMHIFRTQFTQNEQSEVIKTTNNLLDMYFYHGEPGKNEAERPYLEDLSSLPQSEAEIFKESLLSGLSAQLRDKVLNLLEGATEEDVGRILQGNFNVEEHEEIVAAYVATSNKLLHLRKQNQMKPEPKVRPEPKVEIEEQHPKEEEEPYDEYKEL